MGQGERRRQGERPGNQRCAEEGTGELQGEKAGSRTALGREGRREEVGEEARAEAQREEEGLLQPGDRVVRGHGACR